MNEDVLYEDDELEAEDDESDDESVAEDDEFLPLPLPFSPFGGGSRRRGGVRTAPNRSYAGAGMTMWVARPEFNQALSKVRADIVKNSAGIKQVNTRVAAEAAVNARQNQAIVKQNKALTAQSKTIAVVRREVKKAKENALLMAILSRPKTLPPTATASTLTVTGLDGNPQEIQVPQGTRIAYEPEKSNSLLLALALTGGFGGDSNGGGSDMLLPILLMSGGL